MATLKDVAKASGLTVGTVSRVLNNRGYISDKTREKVYQVMKELNYQPNEMARSLSKQKNNTIGIILPQIARVRNFRITVTDAGNEYAMRSEYRL